MRKECQAIKKKKERQQWKTAQIDKSEILRKKKNQNGTFPNVNNKEIIIMEKEQRTNGVPTLRNSAEIAKRNRDDPKI